MLQTFSRSSIAITPTGSQVAADVPITRTLPRLTNDIGLTRPTGEGVSSEDIIPVAGQDGVVFGRNVSLTRLYRNTGSGWVNILSGNGITAVFCRRDGSILFLKDNTNASLYAASEANGWTAVKEQKDGSDFGMTGTTIAWFTKSIHEAAHGTVVWGEYATATANLKIHRKDPITGQWTTVYTVVAADAGTQTHTHCVFYHEAYERWFAWIGDGKNAYIVYSDDDGASWDEYTTAAQIEIQPIQALAYGDLILHGSDTTEGIFVADYSGGPGVAPAVTELVPGIPRHQIARYAFQLDLFAGVYVGSYLDNSGGSREMTYAATDPLGDWVGIASFPSDSTGIEAAFGPVGGYIYAREGHTGGARQVKFRIPAISNVTATEIHPSCTNRLSLAQSEQGSSIINTNGADLTVSANSSADAWTGSTTAFRATRSDGGAGLLFVGGIANTAVPYWGSCHVRGGPNAFTNIQIGFLSDGGAGGFRYSPLGRSMVEISNGPYTPIAGTLYHYISITGKQSTAPASFPIDARVDALAIYENTGGPRCYQPGGTPRSADVLAITEEVGATWNRDFEIWPLYDSDRFTTAHYILTGSAGDSSFALYFDGADSKYKLVCTKDGVAESAVLSAAKWFNPLGMLKINVSLDASDTIISITDAAGSFTLEGIALPDLQSTTVTLTAGGTGTSNKLPMAFRAIESLTSAGNSVLASRSRLTRLHLGI